mgnify:FL=1
MKNKAFTLIEVLVALSIVSIGLIALVQTEAQQSQNLHQLEQKTIASLVASNLAVENRLKKNQSTGFSNGNYSMGNQIWPWQSNLNETPNDQIFRLTLDVYNDKKAMASKKPIAQLELYITK